MLCQHTNKPNQANKKYTLAIMTNIHTEKRDQDPSSQIDTKDVFQLLNTNRIITHDDYIINL